MLQCDILQEERVKAFEVTDGHCKSIRGQMVRKPILELSTSNDIFPAGTDGLETPVLQQRTAKSNNDVLPVPISYVEKQGKKMHAHPEHHYSSYPASGKQQGRRPPLYVFSKNHQC